MFVLMVVTMPMMTMMLLSFLTCSVASLAWLVSHKVYP
jgi:hypothetical protein